jgi:sugar transferase (PEP-CTERM/EpsH1 system associated)
MIVRARRETEEAPLVAHVIHRLGVGGLENGLVNLINRMPEERYRHMIVCLTEATAFAERIEVGNVDVVELHRRAGHDGAVHWRLLKLLREHRPAIVHTRNLGALECIVTSALSGVPARIHGEHGRDLTDIDGSNRRYLALRRAVRPFVSRYVAVSKDLEGWLASAVRVPKAKIVQIYNGVDMEKFGLSDHAVGGGGLASQGPRAPVLIGTVGRLSGEKDQGNLIEAFALLLRGAATQEKCLRLVIIGDGPMRPELEQRVRTLKLEESVEFLGERDDVPALCRSLDIFALPSLGEGISNTILEAMASGLPVVATNVGGNSELVRHGETGFIVPSANAAAMADALAEYVKDAALRKQHGMEGRRRVERCFSMDSMVGGYLELYDSILGLRPEKKEVPVGVRSGRGG